MVTIDEALVLCQLNHRICPMPQKWQELFDLLPDKRRKGGGWEPALPLILAAWDHSPGMMKMIRLREHLEWARDHGALDKVHAYLAGLSETDWFHNGD